MKVWQKQTTRWRLNGKNVPSGTPGAKRETILSKRFYGTLTDSEGRRKQIPLCEERETSLTLLRRLQTEADKQRAIGVPRHVQQRLRPVGELLAEYEAYLQSKANTPRHVKQTIRSAKRLLSACKTSALADIDATRIANTLAAWRGRKAKPISVRTSNFYARAIKGFTRWLHIERRTPDDPLIGLRLLNGNADRRRERRALSPDELTRLTQATEASGKRLFGLRPNDRAMLYRVAAYTGLRASELASLTPASFDLAAMTVTVQASYSKRRRKDVLPLHASLVGLLSAWLPSKQANQPLWRGTWASKHGVRAARMLKRDLQAAGVPYVDDAGRYADFHALRHTFISSLARSGVHPSKAKELARHSTITLTMDVYSHVKTDELRSALNALPDVTS